MLKQDIVIYESTPHHVTMFSVNKPFRLDEFFNVKTLDGPVICRVTETFEKSIHSLSENLKNEVLAHINNDDIKVIYIAEAKVEQEQSTPIPLYEKATRLDTDQITKVLTPTPIDQGLILGEINGTDECYSLCDNALKNILVMLKNGVFEPQKQVPFLLNYYDFYKFPHIGLFGGSGSGKSYALNVILEELLYKRIPNIILDPHFEMNFNQLNDEVEAVRVTGLQKTAFKSQYVSLDVGKDIGINFSDLSVDELCNLMLFKGDLTQPMLALMKDVHEKGDTSILLSKKLKILSKYKEMDDNKEKHDPNNYDAKEINYYESLKSKIPSLATIKALEWRFESLIGENIFNGDISAAERAIKERKTIVLRGSNSHLNMLASYLFKKFYKLRRDFVDSQMYDIKNVEPFPPFFITMDEAHHFAPQGQKISPTKQILKTISQEGRKYGVFEIIATQRPQLLDETIVAQLSTKIILRTNISQDLEVIRKETNLNEEEISRLPYLDSGNAFISSAITRNTVSIRFRANITMPKASGHPFDDLSLFENSNGLNDFIYNHLPINNENIEEIVSLAKNELNDKTLNRIKLLDALKEMHSMNLIVKEKSPFGFIYDRKNS